ncbi:hypothetical protein LPJ53_004778 [Coemansia erecta]|uniref:Uncharacterized protein n=1 Tax=Coemansia erecta TaxID=147472 RepID=A0A9W7XTQ4_9FUNG|nr:hypothetical protein LPJ53_004778 [Coemansia erecta]
MEKPKTATQESLKEKLGELLVLEDELSNLRASATVYTQRTKTPLFFQTTQTKALAAVQHEVKKLTSQSPP